jgi:cell division cycle 14
VLLSEPAPGAGGDEAHFFSVDADLAYWPFFLDYGPLSLSSLYRFSALLSGLLRAHAAPRRLYMWSLAGDAHAAKRANAVYLLAAYLMLCHERSPEEAWCVRARAACLP